MRKVLFVIGVLSNGGAERVISILAKEFCDKGYDVSIITIYGNKNDYILDERVRIYPITSKYSKNIFKVFERIYKTRILIKQIRPDLIISFVAIINIYTIIANAFLKNKIIVSERNDPYQNPENKYIRFIRDLSYRVSNGVVFQTNDAKKYFSKPIQQKGIIIPNPIKSELPVWNMKNNTKTIITACRLSKQKNLPMLIHAFAKIKKNHPDYKLKIYGVGDLRDELLILIEKLNLEQDVLLPGFSKNIHDEMVNSSLFVIPSNYEGISNSMLEALAIGVPVISTDSPIGGARMFINNGTNGILTKVGDTRELTKAIEQVITDEDLSKRFSKNSRKIREELSNEVITNRWVKFIEDIYRDKNTRTKNL